MGCDVFGLNFDDVRCLGDFEELSVDGKCFLDVFVVYGIVF